MKLVLRQIPFIQMGTADRRFNYFKLFEPSVPGCFPFPDKAATRLSSHPGCRFPFLAQGLFPFDISPERSTDGRDDHQGVFKNGGNALQSLHRSPFDLFSNPTHSLLLQQSFSITTTMQFIRIFATLLAFGQWHSRNSPQVVVAYRSHPF